MESKKELTRKDNPSKLLNDPAVQGQAQDDMIPAANEALEEYAEILANELRKRFNDPLKVKKMLKRMNERDLLDQITKIVKAMKKRQVFVSKGFNLNMQQVNHYANEIASSRTRRQELRTEAKRKLQRLPS